MNKRVLVESIFVALLLMALTIVWQIVQGYLLTKSLLEAIPQGSNVGLASDSSVSFGVNQSFNLGNTLLIGGSFLLIAVLYYTVRTYTIKRKTK